MKTIKKNVKLNEGNNNIDLKIEKDKKTTTKIVMSEMGACFSITFLLLILNSIYINGNQFAYYITLSFIKSGDSKSIENIMIGFWVFLDVLVTILIFERWSCNANPSVSFYLFLIKAENGKNTVLKILFQFIGAIIAGAIAMILVNVTMPKTLISSGPSDFTGFLNNNVFGFGKLGTTTHFITGSISILVVEFLAAFGLCWSLLSRSINHKITLITVLMYLFIAASAAAPTGVLSFNAARAFGPILFHDIQLVAVWKEKLTIYNSELASYPFFIIAPALGVYSYYLSAKIFDKKIIHNWLKLVGKKDHE